MITLAVLFKEFFIAARGGNADILELERTHRLLVIIGIDDADGKGSVAVDKKTAADRHNGRFCLALFKKFFNFVAGEAFADCAEVESLSLFYLNSLSRNGNVFISHVAES